MGWCHTAFCSCVPGGAAPHRQGFHLRPAPSRVGPRGARAMLCTGVTHSMPILEYRFHILPSAFLAAPCSRGGGGRCLHHPWEWAPGDPAQPCATLPQPGTHLILLFSSMAVGTDPSQDRDDTMSSKNCLRSNLGDRDVPSEGSDPWAMCPGWLELVGDPGPRGPPSFSQLFPLGPRDWEHLAVIIFLGGGCGAAGFGP